LGTTASQAWNVPGGRISSGWHRGPLDSLASRRWVAALPPAVSAADSTSLIPERGQRHDIAFSRSNRTRDRSGLLGDASTA
jgi:hypothetical protein